MSMPDIEAIRPEPGRRGAETDADEIQATARAFFLVKIASGRVPLVWRGGELDGLRYFTVEIRGERFLLTGDGLLDEPTRRLPRARSSEAVPGPGQREP